MGDERERMSQDIDALKARLLKVTKQWEALYGVLFVKAQRLSDDNAALRGALQALVDATAPQIPLIGIPLIGADEYWDAIAAANAGAVRLLLPEGP